MKKIKAFIFDADWVLIKLTSHFSEFFSQEYNIPYSKIWPFFEDEFKQCVVWKWDLRQRMIPKLQEWNRTGTIDELLIFRFEYASKIDQRLVQIIQDLRAKWYKCYLASNQEKYRIEYMRNVMWISSFFDAIFVSCELWYKKPHLEFYQKTYEKIIDDIDASKDEVLFIDDKENNTEKAKEFWFKSFLYSDFDEFNSLCEAYLGK